uniref:Uncharacterized protein n=1 Tax=Tanacetum cinerariifolium TaxID=118510 RepID=A0A6L2JQY4_TANCI|nr:hypothetical protein [Tanacetum cinerariifolium]
MKEVNDTNFDEMSYENLLQIVKRNVVKGRCAGKKGNKDRLMPLKDGTDVTKGDTGRELLIAMERDANNQMYSIAWVIVRVENAENLVGHASFALSVFGKVLKCGLGLDIVSFNNLTKEMCQNGMVNYVGKVVDEMPKKNVVTYGLMGCVKRGMLITRVNNTLGLYHEMTKKGDVPNNMTYLMKGLCGFGLWVKEKELLDDMLVRRILLDLETFNVVMSLLYKRWMMESGAFFDFMVERWMVANAAMYNALINGYCLIGRVNEGIKLFDVMMCDRNVISYNILINGYYKNDEIDKVVGLMDEICRLKIDPNVVTYTTIIRCLMKFRSYYWVFEFLVLDKKYMESNCLDNVEQQQLMSVDVVRVGVGGSVGGGSVDEGRLVVVRLMRIAGEVRLVGSVVRGLVERVDYPGRSVEVVRWLGSVAVVWLMRISGRGSVGGGLVDEDCGFKPNVYTYTATIGGYCRSMKLDKAKALFFKVKETGVMPNVYTYTVIINIYCRNGELHEANELLNEMQESIYLEYCTVLTVVIL